MGLTLSCQESVLVSPEASDPLAKFLLLIPMTLCSASLELLGQRGEMLSLQDKIMISLNHELKLPPSHLGFLRPLNQQAKKRVIALAGVIDPDYQGLLLHNGSKGEYP